MTKYNAVGLMSGTSLDGLDIAVCEFTLSGNQWQFEIQKATTVPYPNALRTALSNATTLDGLGLTELDHRLGMWMGEQTHAFITKQDAPIDCIASHGHTVFHQPENKFTLQIGNAVDIHAQCDLPVICDFRSMDVAKGGQGAPLVPIGDQLLFGNQQACLNLGGIANISFEKNGNRIAYDICPTNIILNRLANHLGKEYDENGDEARVGEIDQTLLDQLNTLDYYQATYPKSLGYEWVAQQIFPLLDNSPLSIQDLLATCVEHMSIQIGKSLPEGTTMITGGGAFNHYLIERINENKSDSALLSIPNTTIVNYKEALIFAFLGVLKLENKTNVLSSVTGASSDSCSGTVVGAIRQSRLPNG